MVVLNMSTQEKEALLIMFGPIWRKKYWALDGEGGRPSIADGIDFALRKVSKKGQDDLIEHVERYLKDMARRCEKSALLKQS